MFFSPRALASASRLSPASPVPRRVVAAPHRTWTARSHNRFAPYTFSGSYIELQNTRVGAATTAMALVGGGEALPAPDSLSAKEQRDSFELQYQEALTLFCRGKHTDAFELWSLLADNPLALHDTQRKVAISLGQCHATGTGAPGKDPLKAAELFKKAVRLGGESGASAQAGLELGRCLRYELCDDEHASGHASAAVRQFADAARLGSADAAYELGLCYLQGCGNVQVDAAEALGHFEKAAEAGSAEALFKLGQMHSGDFDADGAGGPPGSVSPQQAAKRIRAANIPRDDDKALECFTKCSALGYALAGRRVAKLRATKRQRNKRAKAEARKQQAAAKEKATVEAEAEECSASARAVQAGGGSAIGDVGASVEDAVETAAAAVSSTAGGTPPAQEL